MVIFPKSFSVHYFINFEAKMFMNIFSEKTKYEIQNFVFF